MTWEENFDEKFGVSHDKQEIPEKTWELYSEIKHFIQKTREDAVREALKKVDGEITELFIEHIDKSDPSAWGEDYTIQERLRTEEHNSVVHHTRLIINKHKSIEHTKGPKFNEKA